MSGGVEQVCGLGASVSLDCFGVVAVSVLQQPAGSPPGCRNVDFFFSFWLLVGSTWRFVGQETRFSVHCVVSDN